MKGAEVRIKEANASINEEYRRLDEANGGSHTRRLVEIEKRKTDVVKARERLEDHDNTLDLLEADKMQVEIQYKDFQLLMDLKRNEVQQCEYRLNSMIKDRGQQRGAYHPSMPRLLNAIEQDGDFLQKPIGPVGNHIRLLKPLWSSVLEKSFGGALNSFIVTSKQDQSRLSALMQKIGW